jgi:acyl-CoA thioesterase-2
VLALTVSFHEPVRADEWMLYAHESPHYARAQVFAESGRLLASFSLEGMLRGIDEVARRMGPPRAL